MGSYPIVGLHLLQQFQPFHGSVPPKCPVNPGSDKVHLSGVVIMISAQ